MSYKERKKERERERIYLNTVFLQFLKIVLQESRHNIIHQYLQIKVIDYIELYENW